ncbi:very short patch repair endonuclease [Caballeronia sordidicola]|uniref:very short patch repair endonuclease n=1 Tax=Caballeronia sordidicola TaxID=196367 RepID=UPI000A37D202
MVDNLSATSRRKAMTAVKGKNTAPELKVRKQLRELGYMGYRLHRADLAGCPDVAWIGRKTAIFVHGCFWHGHDCPRGSRIPVTRRDYWQKKIQSNVQRDKVNEALLTGDGWKLLVLWECQIKSDARLRCGLEDFLGPLFSKHG